MTVCWCNAICLLKMPSAWYVKCGEKKGPAGALPLNSLPLRVGAFSPRPGAILSSATPPRPPLTIFELT